MLGIEFQTLFICLVTIGSLFFAGLPVAVFLMPKQKTESLWVIAPFLGLACIVLLLQNLIYLGIPISKSCWSVWIGALVLWVCLLKTGEVKKLWPIPKLLLCLAFFMYLFQGLGLLLVGSKFYVGYGWYDQLNYVSVSQFLMNHSLIHTSFQNVILQPSAIKALSIISFDRIGEEIFQGFIACSLLSDAKTVFEPVILLLSFLIVLVIYELAIRFSLSKNAALIVAVFSASLPSIATIHLESFLSQALITPLLLLWPVILSDILMSKTVRGLMVGALLLAVVASVYLEFYLIFLALTCGFALFTFMQSKKIIEFVFLIIMIIVALGLNIGFLSHFFDIGSKAMHAHHWKKMYPWLNFMSALDWLWLGYLASLLKGVWQIIVDKITMLFCIIAYMGFGWALYQKRDAMRLSVLLMIVLPLVLGIINLPHYGYHFFKLMLSVSALLPLGVVLTYQFILNRNLISRSYYSGISYLAAMAIALFSINVSLLMILASTRVELFASINQGIGYKLLSPETRDVQSKLATLTGENIVIAWQETYRQGDYINGWLSYFARHNQVWLTNSFIGDKNLAAYLAKISTVPTHYLLLTTTVNPLFPFPRVLKEKIWGNQTYSLWRVG